MRVIVVGGNLGEGGAIIPANGLIPWDGTGTLDPTKWEIYTPAQGVFIRGATWGGLSTAISGASSHLHTMPSSTGSVGDHQHSTSGGDLSNTSSSEEFYGTSNSYTAPENHDHSMSSTACSSAGAHSHTISGNTGYATSNPPYVTFHWIRALKDAPMPDGAHLLYKNNTLNQEGFSLVTNLNGRFIMGATSSPGQTFGLATHTHITPNSYGGGAHTHNISFSSGSSGSNKNASTYDGTSVGEPHSHSGSRDVSENDHSHTLSDTNSAANLPPFTDVAMYRSVASRETPSGAIIAFVGSSAPTDWLLCNGANNTINLVYRYVRIQSSTFTAGGSSSHNHTNPNAVAVGNHNHGGGTGGTVWNSGSVKVTVGSPGWTFASSQNHSHNWGVDIGWAGTHGHTVGATGYANHEPRHIKLYFIQKI